MDKQHNQYLSDEDLQKLIADVEANHMVSAPSYLKSETVQRMHKRLAAQKQISANRKLFYFSTKVIAATAASLALLFFTPDMRQITVPSTIPMEEETPSFAQKIHSITSQVCDSLNEQTNKLITFGGNNYDK